MTRTFKKKSINCQSGFVELSSFQTIVSKNTTNLNDQVCSETNRY